MENEAVGRREALAKDILILSRNTLLVNLRFLDLALSRFALVPVPPLNPLLLESIAVDGAIDALFSDEVRDIVILTCKTENESILTPHLVNGGYPAGKKTIRFTTCRKFKGLEADAVILVDVDKTTFTGNDGQNVLLYYVGTSRARLRLDVIAQLDDNDCLAVLEALGKAGKAKRPRRDLARALNAVAQIAD